MDSDREAVEAIVKQHGFQDDAAYGHTKLFVRTPRSLFTLEQERAALIPILVLFLQKVSRVRIARLCIYLMRCATQLHKSPLLNSEISISFRRLTTQLDEWTEKFRLASH